MATVSTVQTSSRDYGSDGFEFYRFLSVCYEVGLGV